ncbi:hypothetical protein LEP1GSC110_1015 [Leptospira interrogans serovar Medanensis str. UT053]|nr:hypothetical protein LEP1GSC110_1015 [Leptospira interrogans serovar Medanensis str. UT053]
MLKIKTHKDNKNRGIILIPLLKSFLKFKLSNIFTKSNIKKRFLFYLRRISKLNFLSKNLSRKNLSPFPS